MSARPLRRLPALTFLYSWTVPKTNGGSNTIKPPTTSRHWTTSSLILSLLPAARSRAARRAALTYQGAWVSHQDAQLVGQNIPSHSDEPNYRAALDAAMTILLHIAHQWRRASERGRWLLT